MTLIKEDAIQKKLTMNANNKRYYSEEYIKGWEDGVRDQYNATMPTNDNWIPVSERLPENKEETYWVCTDTEYQCECRWTNISPIFTYMTTDWHWNWFDIPQYTKVTAWQPLPTPYKGE